MEKSKAEESPWKKLKRESKKGPKKKGGVPFCQEKKKKSVVKASGIGGAPRWHPDFKQRSRRRTKLCRI